MWRAFVFVVLALSGVEAIANLTGVMKKPVYQTARKSIWFVAAEVALFNLLLALAMLVPAPRAQARIQGAPAPGTAALADSKTAISAGTCHPRRKLRAVAIRHQRRPADS